MVTTLSLIFLALFIISFRQCPSTVYISSTNWHRLCVPFRKLWRSSRLVWCQKSLILAIICTLFFLPPVYTDYNVMCFVFSFFEIVLNKNSALKVCIIPWSQISLVVLQLWYNYLFKKKRCVCVCVHSLVIIDFRVINKHIAIALIGCYCVPPSW